MLVHGLGGPARSGRRGRRGARAGRAHAPRAVPRPLSRTSSPAGSGSGSRSPPASCSSRAAGRRRAGVDARRLGARRDPRAPRRPATSQGWAILMITHDLSTAAHFADRIAVMYLGRIVEEGPAREVVRNPQHPYTQALLSVVPKPRPARAVEAADPARARRRTRSRAVGLPVPSALPEGVRPLRGRGSGRAHSVRRKRPYRRLLADRRLVDG